MQPSICVSSYPHSYTIGNVIFPRKNLIQTTNTLRTPRQAPAKKRCHAHAFDPGASCITCFDDQFLVYFTNISLDLWCIYIYVYMYVYIYAPETMDGQVLWLAIYSLVYLPIWLGDVWCKCWSIFQAMSSVQRLGKQSCSISFGLIFPLKWTWSLTTG